MNYALYIMNYFVPLHRNLDKNEQKDYHSAFCSGFSLHFVRQLQQCTASRRLRLPVRSGKRILRSWRIQSLLSGIGRYDSAPESNR